LKKTACCHLVIYSSKLKIFYGNSKNDATLL
jgi:hypothetical protein